MTMNDRKITFTHFENEISLEERCVLNKMIKIIGKRWVPEMLLFTEKDICRFSGIKKKVYGISDNALSQNLHGLVRSRLLLKRIYQQVPLKVEYTLSQRG